MERLISLLGLFAMMGMAYLMCEHKKRINLRVVWGGLLLQFALALFILKTRVGRVVFNAIGGLFTTLLGYVDAGASFVFGNAYTDHYFAFKVLPTIIFFSALMAMLYHMGIVQKIVAACAYVMQRTLGTSGAESLSAAGNIFVGQTEAPLMVRPYVSQMTRSELMAVMVGGFATIAGGVMAAYASMGIDAGHLISASVISAPAALLIAKLMIPETEHSVTLGHVEMDVPQTNANLIDAATTGALDGLKLVLNVAAMLIAVLGLVALVDGLIGWIGTALGYPAWSMSAALAYLFAPFAYLLGIPMQDCLLAGELLGKKMVLNEFVAYAQLSEWLKPDSGVALSERSIVILTYALCGFANFGSVGIQIGGIGGIAPERRADLALLGMRAMIGGTLACMMTACVAGILL